MLNINKKNKKNIPEINFDQEINYFYSIQKKHLNHLIIFILYKGSKLPKYCFSMLRKPPPKVNIKINKNLALVYSLSLKHNPAIEDGAILIQAKSDKYILKLYSCRIYPPHKKEARSVANKGSGYNSSIYYSCVSRVISVYFINKEGVKKFVKGKEVKFNE